WICSPDQATHTQRAACRFPLGLFVLGSLFSMWRMHNNSAYLRNKDIVMSTKLPTYFISHGGGPWTHMKAQLGHTYDALEASLTAIPRQIGGTKPQAVLVI